jgi:hypothetical protein
MVSRKNMKNTPLRFAVCVNKKDPCTPNKRA